MDNATIEVPSQHWLDSWHVNPCANRTYDFIDGLRGVAILMVVACHYCAFDENDTIANKFLHGCLSSLAMGVTLFFTISGFLISWPFWRRKVNRIDPLMPPGYGWRRFWKIYPPLALSVLVLVPLFIIWQGNARLFAVAAAQWLSGVGFFVPVTDKFNPPMWSLVVEIHFYMVLPVLFLLTKSLSPKVCLALISLFLFFVPALAKFMTGLAPSFSPRIEDPYLTGLSFFCFGVAVAGIDNMKVWNRHWVRVADVGWIILLCGMLGMACVRLSPHTHAGVGHLFNWLSNIGMACLLCYATDLKNPRAQWLCAPWLRWFGLISFECYLFHLPMLLFALALFGSASEDLLKHIGIVALSLAGTLIVAALVYRKFSLPILKYGRSGHASK
jgi:peptidoglycan/LPS O-acetylase OafA/YrhL